MTNNVMFDGQLNVREQLLDVSSQYLSSKYIPTVVAEEGGEGNSGWKDRGLH